MANSFTPIQQNQMRFPSNFLKPTFGDKIILFDTETDDFDMLPQGYAGFSQKGKFLSEPDKYPRILSIAWIVYSFDTLKNVNVVKSKYYVVKRLDIAYINKINKLGPEDFAKGHDLNVVLNEFVQDLNAVKFIQGYNLAFDMNVLKAELFKQPNLATSMQLNQKILNDVMFEYAGFYKCRWQKLGNAFESVFALKNNNVRFNVDKEKSGRDFEIDKYLSFKESREIDWHDARADVFATLFIFVHIYFSC